LAAKVQLCYSTLPRNEEMVGGRPNLTANQTALGLQGRSAFQVEGVADLDG